jgi:DNA-binding NarL/FixJ family response regulator
MDVIIVEDSSQYRLAVKTFLEEGLGHSVIADVPSCDDLISISNLSNAKLILVGLKNNFADNIQAICPVLNDHPHLKLIALSMELHLQVIADLFRLGFNGFILKDRVFEEMSTAINAVVYNNVYLPISISQ